MTSTVPNTKPEPVRLYGAIITGLTVITGGITLVAGLQDNATLATVVGVIGLVIAGANAAKDQYVRSQVIPAADVASYVNDERQVVTGPAVDGPATPVEPQLSKLDRMDGIGRAPQHAAPDIDDTL